MKNGFSRSRFVAFGIVLLFGVGLVLVPSHSLYAQLRVGVGADVTSRHVFRGLTYGDGPTLHPSFFVEYGSRATRFSAGWWSSAALTDVDPRTGIGFDDAFSEHNVWLQAIRRLGPIDLAAGGSWYGAESEEASGPPARAVDTWEVYARLAWIRSRFNPSLFAVWDVDRIGGLFLHPELTYRVPLWPGVPIHLGVMELHLASILATAGAGFNFGQQVGAGSDGYYEDEGFTHADVQLSLPLGVGFWIVDAAVTPFLKVQYSYDPHTRVNHQRSSELDRNTKTWGGVYLTLAFPRCRPDRSLCR